MNYDIIIAISNRVLPLFLLGFLGYGIFAFSYVYAYHEIYKFHSQSVAIGLIAISAFFGLLVLLDWIQLLIIGPGRITGLQSYKLAKNHETFDSAVEPPDAFICDPYGHPFWCSSCQSIKPDRVHHSAELGYCVDKMDHMCNWLGAVIGRENYRYFVLVQIHFLAIIIIVFSSVPIHIRDIFRRPDPSSHRAHCIVLLSIAGVWALLLIPFLINHIKYTLTNTTTLEFMKFNKKGSEQPIFNVVLPYEISSTLGIPDLKPNESVRIVSRMRLNDPRPYDRGRKWDNWTETMGKNPILWFLPIPTKRGFNKLLHYNSYIPDSNVYYSPSKIFHNPKLVSLFIERFKNGDEGFYAYPHLQGINVPPPQKQEQSEQTSRTLVQQSDNTSKNTDNNTSNTTTSTTPDNQNRNPNNATKHGINPSITNRISASSPSAESAPSLETPASSPVELTTSFAAITSSSDSIAKEDGYQILTPDNSDSNVHKSFDSPSTFTDSPNHTNNSTSRFYQQPYSEKEQEENDVNGITNRQQISSYLYPNRNNDLSDHLNRHRHTPSDDNGDSRFTSNGYNINDHNQFNEKLP